MGKFHPLYLYFEESFVRKKDSCLEFDCFETILLRKQKYNLMMVEQ